MIIDVYKKGSTDRKPSASYQAIDMIMQAGECVTGCNEEYENIFTVDLNEFDLKIHG